MMKKICYITTISITVKAFFTEQLKYLAKSGYDVSVICSPDDTLGKTLGEDIKYIPVDIVRGISPPNILKTIKVLFKIFKKEKYDIIQYSTPNAALCASIAGKLAGIKIRNYHLMGLRYFGAKKIGRYMLKFLEKLTCDFSTHIECVSKSNAEIAVKEGLFKENKVTVVWNGSSGGVNVKRFDFEKRDVWREEIRSELGIAQDIFVFGFAGRITKDKGINEILSAFERMNKDCVLLIIGDKEGIQTLDAKLWKFAVDDKRIIIHDSVSDIEKYYSAMDVLLLPSYREGFGMVIAEAAAVGTPAIVSDIPGPIDVIRDKVTAYKVKPGDCTELQAAMERFLKNPSLAKEMEESCESFIKEKFDSVKLCEKIYERKEDLLKK